MDDLRNKRVTVMGLGHFGGGIAVAKWLAAQGAKVLVTDRQEAGKLKESVDQQRPIAWVKVHNLPDFVYFNHSQHVVSGVACQRCHGPVESMDRVAQVSPLTMGWCLGCHRAEAHVPTSSFGRVAANLMKRPTPFAGEDCTSCHY